MLLRLCSFTRLLVLFILLGLTSLPARADITYNLPASASSLPGSCSYASASATITCTGSPTFNDNTTFNLTQNLTLVINGTLTTNQSFTINTNGYTFNIQIGGNLITQNAFYNYGANISTGGYIDIRNQITSTGDLTAGTTLTLQNAANISGNLSAGSLIDVRNNATISGNLTTTGSNSNITFHNQISVNGNISSAGSLNIKNNANITGNITTVTTLTINNNLIMVGNISTGGDIVFDNNANVTGDISSGEDITIKNNFDLTGNITAAGTLDIKNNYTINGTCTATIYQPSTLICSYGLSISAAASISEGNSGTSNLAFTVTLSKASSNTVTVKYSTADGTATGGGSCATNIDYLSASNVTITFTAGQTTKTIYIPICGDTIQEPDETFTVTLASPSNASLGSNKTGTGTIINDDTSAPASFNAVDTGANGVSGKIGTKVVGSTFSVDVVALNSGKTAVDTSINQQVKVELIANATATTVGSNNCPSGGTAITVGTATLTAGKAAVSVAAVSSAYRDVRVRISYPATGTATVTACSADNFAIRPATLSLAVQDTNWITAGTSRDLNNISASGGVVHKAGQPFTVSATAYASNGNQVSNYDGGAMLVATGCATPPTDVCPASLGSLTPTSLTFASGSASNSGVSYSEVGSFKLELRDTTFAAADANDGTPTQCQGPGYDSNQTPGLYACSQPTDVGRFVPDHYAVTSAQTPQLQTFGSSCASRSFTYLGQTIGFATLPKVTITAQNAANGTTANYKGNLWKLTATHLAGNWSCQIGASGACPTVTSTAPPFADPVSNGNGTGTFTWPTNATYLTGLAYSLARGTAQAPFTPTIGLGITVADTSETGCGTTPCTLIDNQGSTPTWSSVAFDSGAEFRHGRLKIGNAYGATSLDLAIPLEVQYYSAGSFVTNTADNCTTLTAGNIGLRNPQRELGATEIASSVNLAGGSFTSGQKKLRLAKPSGGNGRYDGTVDVFAYLASDSQCIVSGGTVAKVPTTASLAHLQDSWPWDHNGTTSISVNCQNPVGRATFGLERQKFLYMREQY